MRQMQSIRVRERRELVESREQAKLKLLEK